MKKILIILCILSVVLSSVSCGCAPESTVEDQASAPPSASPTATVEPTAEPTSEAPNVIPGTVYDATMSTLVLITDDRSIYSFSEENADLTATDNGIIIGYPVTVGYYGDLDDEQTVEASYIDVGNFDGLTAEEKARHIMLTLSLEQEVGQMFIVSNPETQTAEAQTQYQFGGYILHDGDFAGRTPDEARAYIQSCQDVSLVPMFIGVDEEGGTVNRVSWYSQYRSTPFRSSQELYASGGWDAITSDTTEKCALLSSLGINLNFAPVCDVSTDPTDFIYARAFGQDAAETSVYVETVVKTMAGTGIGCVLKHFPGYGNNVDTHTGSAYDSRSYETFENSDFLPFDAGIKTGAGAVLVSHNVVACMDDATPASLSPEVHRILREKLGFQGVIITDALDMEAITDFTDSRTAAVMAVEAGNDMLCCSDYETPYAAVLDTVNNGEISRGRIDESVMRVLMLKISLGIL